MKDWEEEKEANEVLSNNKVRRPAKPLFTKEVLCSNTCMEILKIPWLSKSQ